MGCLRKCVDRSAFTFIMVLGLAGLSACTTVDLSQIAANKQVPMHETMPAANIVQRTSSALNRLCQDKGWSKTRSEKTAQTAVSVLLNGMEKDKLAAQAMPARSMPSLLADIVQINDSVEQAAKAAEVFLVMAEQGHDLNMELSQLELALLSVRETQIEIGKAVEGKNNANVSAIYQNFQSSIDDLKEVTNAYGIRIRSTILNDTGASN